jgi:hypothetical protein
MTRTSGDSGKPDRLPRACARDRPARGGSPSNQTFDSVLRPRAKSRRWDIQGVELHADGELPALLALARPGSCPVVSEPKQRLDVVARAWRRAPGWAWRRAPGSYGLGTGLGRQVPDSGS